MIKIILSKISVSLESCLENNQFLHCIELFICLWRTKMSFEFSLCLVAAYFFISVCREICKAVAIINWLNIVISLELNTDKFMFTPVSQKRFYRDFVHVVCLNKLQGHMVILLRGPCMNDGSAI